MADRIKLADVLGDECSSPDCASPPMGDTPLPICERHYLALIRHYQQLVKANGLTASEWDQAAGLGEIPRDPVETPIEYVYFIQYRDRVKIGTTTNLRSRLASLPLDNVLAVIHGGRATEREWHDRYHDFRDRGEWFIPNPPMLREIQALGICA